MQQIQFARGLIKGKIAEIVFETMMSNTHQYKLIHFGYEHTTPELVTREVRTEENKEILQMLSNAPDYIEVDSSNKVTLVEVKFRRKYRPEYLVKTAKSLQEKWSGSWLFVATPERFYFDNTDNVVANNGSMSELDEGVVGREVQDDYLELLREFISGGS